MRRIVSGDGLTRVMDDTFSNALNEWTAYYALMGGAAATLLGLLFVAVSLRLNIFHQRNVADVRDFAALTFGTFLVALVVAGLALSPHERQARLAQLLLVVGIIGVLAIALIARTWVRLNLPATTAGPGFTSSATRGWVFMLGMAAPYPGLIVVAVLLF